MAYVCRTADGYCDMTLLMNVIRYLKEHRDEK